MHMFRRFLLGVILSTSTHAVAQQTANPLATLKHEHPRLYASPQRFAEMKNRIAANQLLNQWQGNLRQEADKLLTAPPSSYEIPDGKRLLATSRRVLDRVMLLAWMYRIEGHRKYAERAWRELEAAANFKDWNPSHFLDTAEMTHAFAIGYDWLYDVWTPAQRTTLRTAIIEKGLNQALKAYRGKQWWSSCHHNWSQVCNGGITTGALAIGDEAPELATEIVASAVRSVPLAMAEFAPDGAWPEGPGYWGYATMYNVAMIATLESALGTDFGLSAIPGFAETGAFPIYMSGPTGRSFSFADCHAGAIKSPVMFWFGTKFNHPEYAVHQLTQIHPQPLDLLWYDAKLAATPTPALPTAKYFRHVEAVSMRGAWNDPRTTFVGFKAGDNKANHSHLDIGSFVLDALGVRWGVDMGSDNYNMPGYFGSKRWTYYRLRAESHNTLVINPGQDPDQDPKATTAIVKFTTAQPSSSAVADLTAAYAKHAKSVQRGISLLNGHNVLVQDEITSKDQAADVWWFFHTGAEINLSADGATATLTSSPDSKKSPSVQLSVKLLSPAGAKFAVANAKPLPTSPNPSGQNENKNIQQLTIHLPATTTTRIAVLFTPLNTTTTAPTTPTLVPLAQW